MDDNFFAYLQQLEMMAFFSGYPLLYAIVTVIAGRGNNKSVFRTLLPVSYAIAGVLYIGLLVKQLYPDYSLKNFTIMYTNRLLVVWGMLSVGFFISFFRKRPVWSLLHSLIFFFFPARDIINHLFSSSSGKDAVRNDMKIYTDSILLNSGVFVVVISIFFVFSKIRKKKRAE